MPLENLRSGCAVAGQRAADQLADERKTGALMLAEGADCAGAAAVIALAVRIQRAVEQRGIAGERSFGTDQRVRRQRLPAMARDLTFPSATSDVAKSSTTGA